jgi:hypothetical protein
MSRRLTPQKLAVLERRKAVAERYLRQETQGEIAGALGVGQATVSRDLEATRLAGVAAQEVGSDKAQSEAIKRE